MAPLKWQLHRVFVNRLVGSSQTIQSSGSGRRECSIIPMCIGLRSPGPSPNSDRSLLSCRSISGAVISRFPAVVLGSGSSVTCSSRLTDEHFSFHPDEQQLLAVTIIFLFFTSLYLLLLFKPMSYITFPLIEKPSIVAFPYWFIQSRRIFGDS